MGIECGVIAGIFVLFVLIFFRRGHNEWALATLPLILLPFADFVLEIVVVKVFKVQVTAFGAMMTLVVALAGPADLFGRQRLAVALAAAWIGAASNLLKTKHNKRTATFFISISNLFNVTLTAILIMNILSRAEKLEAIIK